MDTCSVCADPTFTGQRLVGASHDAIADSAAALATADAPAATNQTPQPHVCWTGQVFSKRSLHKSLLFLGLRADGSVRREQVAVMCADDKMEQSPGAAISAVQDVFYKVKLGDLVTVHGWLDTTRKTVVEGKDQKKFAVTACKVRVDAAWATSPVGGGAAPSAAAALGRATVLPTVASPSAAVLGGQAAVAFDPWTAQATLEANVQAAARALEEEAELIASYKAASASSAAGTSNSSRQKAARLAKAKEAAAAASGAATSEGVSAAQESAPIAATATTEDTPAAPIIHPPRKPHVSPVATLSSRGFFVPPSPDAPGPSTPYSVYWYRGVVPLHLLCHHALHNNGGGCKRAACPNLHYSPAAVAEGVLRLPPPPPLSQQGEEEEEDEEGDSEGEEKEAGEECSASSGAAASPAEPPAKRSKLAPPPPPAPLPSVAEVQAVWALWRQVVRASRTLHLAEDATSKADFHDAVGHAQRAHAFAEWLLGGGGGGGEVAVASPLASTRAAITALLKERGALDVGGGRGDVAVLLAMRGGVRVSLVDARPTPTLRKTAQRHFAAHPSQPRPILMHGWFGPDWVTDPSNACHLAAVNNRSLPRVALGFHPDQATEPLVDHAIATRTPFVVVPCCVFSKDFPERYLTSSDGSKKHVTSYEDFITYLQAKAPGIVTDFLAYHGRNTVLAWVPPAEEGEGL